MNKALHFCATAALLLLTACGGGDSNPPPVDGGQAGGSNDKPPFLIEADHLETYGVIAVNLPEAMLKIAYYSSSLLSQSSFSNEEFVPCINGGQRTTKLSQPMPLTVGMVIIEQLNDCEIKALDSTLNGKIVVTITEHELSQDSEIFGLEVDLSKAIFRDSLELSVTDQVKVTLTSDGMLRKMQIKPSNTQVRFRFSDGDEFKLSQFQLTHELNLATALYRSEYQGRIALNQFIHDLAVTTTEPLQGFLGEYPHQGQIELSDSRNNKLMISANQVLNSELAKVQLNQGSTNLYYWNALADGAYWSTPGFYRYGYAQNFRYNNFDFLGTLSSSNFDDFQSMGTITYLFSRPVASVDVYRLNTFFSTWEWGFSSIAAEVATEGALVHLRPKVALHPGMKYQVAPVIATNEQGLTQLANSFGIQVSNAIQALIRKDRASVTKSAQPILSANDSIVATGLTASYHWQELSNHGIVFNNPTAAITSFNLPAQLSNQLIDVRVTVTDELGHSHSADTQMYYLDAEVNALYYESDITDQVGHGQNLILTSDSADFETFSRSKNHLHVNIDGYNTFDFNWWRLDISTASDKELQPGLYQHATLEASKPEHGNGLDFSINYLGHRSCNTVTGWFEIFEIEFADAITEGGDPYFFANKLALDFVQQCDGSEATLRGRVRINSSHPF